MKNAAWRLNARPLEIGPVSQEREGFDFAPEPAPRVLPVGQGRVLDDGWRDRQEALAVADEEFAAAERRALQRVRTPCVRVYEGTAFADEGKIELPMPDFHAYRRPGSRFVPPRLKLRPVQDGR